MAERSAGLQGQPGTLRNRGGCRARRPFDPLRAKEYPAVIGCDEVGRGALCGPVIVAAVWFDPSAIPAELLAGLDDSKRLTRRQRERLSDLIMASSEAALAAGSVARIDRYGVRVATLDAMCRAVERLGVEAPVHFDGVDVPDGLRARAIALVRGESTTPQIAAASVVAKVFRDRLIARLAARHAHYGWQKNAGYGTAEHLAALADHGPTPHHRRSFRPVAQSATRGMVAAAGGLDDRQTA